MIRQLAHILIAILQNIGDKEMIMDNIMDEFTEETVYYDMVMKNPAIDVVLQDIFRERKTQFWSYC